MTKPCSKFPIVNHVRKQEWNEIRRKYIHRNQKINYNDFELRQQLLHHERSLSKMSDPLLHEAVKWFQAPIDIIKLLIAVYPESLLVKNVNDRVLLHQIIPHFLSALPGDVLELDRFKLILNASPLALNIRDVHGSTPLHEAVRSSVVSLGRYSVLFTARKYRAIRDVCRLVERKSAFSSEIVEQHLTSFIESPGNVFDNANNTPLHKAIQSFNSKGFDLKSVDLLLEFTDMSILMKENDQGMKPIDYFKYSLQTPSFLSEANHIKHYVLNDYLSKLDPSICQ